jgi:hypothetical protein
MEFTMAAGSVPAGSYFASFEGAEPYRENSDRYGEGVLLKFRIVGGAHDGGMASRICASKMSVGSALGKFAVALKGGPISIGERFSFASYIGVRGSLLVEPTQNGGSRVSAFIREQPMPQSTLQPGNGQSCQQPVQPIVERF